MTNAQNMETAPVAVNRSNSPGKTRLPLVVYVLALGTFLMLTTELSLLGSCLRWRGSADPARSGGQLDLGVRRGHVHWRACNGPADHGISKRLILVLALIVFVGHVVVAMATDFRVLLVARLRSRDISE